MALKYVQTNTLYLAGSGVVVGATSITLTTLTDIYGNVLTMSDFGDKGYITLEPDTTNEEAAIFTGITANSNGTYTLTGIKTVLAKSPYTETSGLVRSHAGGTKVVVTDNVGFWNTFANKKNDETIDGQWTFTVFPITPSNSDASTTVKGVTKLSVAPASATVPIAVGTNDPRIPVAYAVDAAGSDAYAITPSPAITAYTAGQMFTFKAGTANTGASTLNVNGLGAKTITKNVSSNISTGDILLNQVVTVVYDGTNMQIQSKTASPIPVVNVYGPAATKGSSTTQFDITNPAGTTFRYTFDGTGTDPVINTTTVPTGSRIAINGTSFTAANNGTFTVTGSGNNFFEVTNASGVAENNKTLGGGGGTGFFFVLQTTTTWTKQDGLKYISVQTVGGGGAGNGVTAANSAGDGGGSSGYSSRVIPASSLGATETVTVGAPGVATGVGAGSNGSSSSFGSFVTANGGNANGTGGTATDGDVNVIGNCGVLGYAAVALVVGGTGGSSFFGGSGYGSSTAGAGAVNGGNATGYGSGGGGAVSGSSAADAWGGNGYPGVVIVTEYYA